MEVIVTARTQWPLFSILLAASVTVVLTFGLGLLLIVVVIFTGETLPLSIWRPFARQLGDAIAIWMVLAGALEWGIRAFIIRRGNHRKNG